VVSARVLAAVGFPAIATTSGGVAAVHGLRDGQAIPVDAMLAAVASIARTVDIPVSADMEAGFGLEPAELAERIAATGAVGLNFEDQAGDADAHAGRIAGVKAAVPHLVVNARVDVYLREWEPDGRFDESVRRARLYLDAGADCTYVIGYLDDETTAALAAAIPGPLNVMVGPTTPPVPRLREVGVRRVSTASGLYRATVGALRRLATELRATGTYHAFLDEAVSSRDLHDFLPPGTASR
jgi:2-methylisocitrate lyase-like PEP mutase family enzyme